MSERKKPVHYINTYMVGCRPWGCKESDTTEQLHFHFSLSCVGEGNGNLLQCSCLENPRDGGAWWATVYGVPQSRTRLKRLTSSSSSIWNLERWQQWPHMGDIKRETDIKNRLLDSVGEDKDGIIWQNSIEICIFSSVQSLSHVRLFATPWITPCRPPCPSPTPGVHSNSCPSSQWCHPAISSSVIPFSSCPLSLPASDSLTMSQLFSWDGQSIGVSASFLPMNTQDWSPLGWTGWISLHSKGLSRVFSNTTVQKHQFFGAQLSSQSNSHIYTWPLEKP